ncbi:MAG: metallophosphoesterase [Clostridia bacterium]|nr:metallophosphoesterase [Clostridia bacterium]
MEASSTIFCGTPEHPETCIKRLESGLFLREMTFDSGKGGEPVTIGQTTDLHFNYCDEIDLANRELAYTVTTRKWLANAESVNQAKQSLAYAAGCDQIVITGDVLDYLSHGAMTLTEELIWKPYPDALITPGGHEFTRQMQTGLPNETTIESRVAEVEKFWHHDMQYISKVLGGKCMIVLMNNGLGKYLDCQVERFADDIAAAKREGYVMLLFQHEPICTFKPEDTDVPAFYAFEKKSFDFYNRSVGSPAMNPDEPTQKIVEMIRSNADVIGGIFCGHRHSAFYLEVDGWYTDADGNRVSKAIPQPVLEGNPYCKNGHVMKITVK